MNENITLTSVCDARPGYLVRLAAGDGLDERIAADWGVEVVVLMVVLVVATVVKYQPSFCFLLVSKNEGNNL